ncbi:MAG TPA: DUF1343 domain-containing protein [Cytophagaceae bacterium]|jgi:uncharacterized protein YbbC (DUF1343 family)|nr:DUF1343 domain-containing protein [Cytophagaceae bacterium]
MFSKFIALLFSSFLILLSIGNCAPQLPTASAHGSIVTDKQPLVVGAAQLSAYLHILEDKKIGLVVNNTSVVNKTHLLDTLLLSGIDVVKIFAPEHGFRGNADNGEQVKDEVDPATGLPIYSLHGKNKKPTAEQLKGLDILVFDMQDIGVRFYTYYCTMFYVMQAAAENNVAVLILDRPNPNGHYVDGPVLDTVTCRSFVGLLPLPIVHGLTLGEMAQMINGEEWLGKNKKCNIKIIPVLNYTHTTSYSLPIRPSPNMPNDLAIQLYPSVCLFEGTKMSMGRGTYFPFQVVGYPDSAFGSFTFTPVSIVGMSKEPPYKNQKCYGIDLRTVKPNGFTMKYLLDMYQKDPDKTTFFISFFEKLIGNKQVRGMIERGDSEATIRASWQNELDVYKTMRKKYLLYTDFE